MISPKRKAFLRFMYDIAPFPENDWLLEDYINGRSPQWVYLDLKNALHPLFLKSFKFEMLILFWDSEAIPSIPAFIYHEQLFNWEEFK